MLNLGQRFFMATAILGKVFCWASIYVYALTSCKYFVLLNLEKICETRNTFVAASERSGFCAIGIKIFIELIKKTLFQECKVSCERSRING